MSDLESSEVTISSKRLSSDHFAPEDTPIAGREREGLPASYRMRADAHYVDQLVSRRDRVERLDRERTERPAETPEAAPPRERQSDRVLKQLHEELAALVSASAMLGHASPLARRLGADLVRAETWRAQWLVRAQMILDGRERAYPRARPVGPFAEDLRTALNPECRLAGATLQVAASDWNATVMADEAMLMTGVTGAVLALLGLTTATEGTIVRVTFDIAAGEVRAVEVSLEEVVPGPSAAQRFFEVAWVERPGGWIAALGAATSRAVAQQHGGAAVFQAGDRRRAAVRLALTKLH